MRMMLAFLAVLAGCAIAAPSSSAVTAQWWACGKAGSAKTAQAAGFPAAMDADPRLREVFGTEPPSSILRPPRGGRLIVRSPKYGPNDANCCPGAISTRTLRYSHGRWAGTVSVRRAR